MGINSIFDIAGQAMSAQSVRMNTVASNLANAEAAASSVDEVYRARVPVFAAVQRNANQAWGEPSEFDMPFEGEVGLGVQVLGIVESSAELQRRYEPDHPLADEEGYVLYPNVNVVEQMADMISASRAFQINVEMMQTAKSMAQRLLNLGQ
ncbi:MAG: flagellar basal body rod protein FlgC [Spongiibacteraceae bacterium]|jgi:flagellar basal-body rod protein FlgC|nr:flagellar basal body rod protein FlgC [Spongiibacteraceae bacterium]